MTDSTNVNTAVEAVGQTDVAGTVSAIHDLSAWGMFMSAGLIGKVVMILLILASFWSWAIIFDKWMRFKMIKQKATRFEHDFWSAEALDTFYDKMKRRATHPFAVVFLSAMEEWFRSDNRQGSVRPRTSILVPGVITRIAQIMNVARNRELEDLEKGLGFLATVGSAAPFVGLFGTVWGIMSSFQSIASSKNTSLAVVAPGIAEALFATALGLAAAIPAVIAYNKFSNELAKYSGKLEDFCTEFLALLSRQADQAGRP